MTKIVENSLFSKMYPKFLNSSSKNFENFIFLKMLPNIFENFQNELYFPNIVNVPKIENLKN